jgi:hypothetical protein
MALGQPRFLIKTGKLLCFIPALKAELSVVTSLEFEVISYYRKLIIVFGLKI